MGIGMCLMPVAEAQPFRVVPTHFNKRRVGTQCALLIPASWYHSDSGRRCFDTLVLDSAGNLYGTAYSDGRYGYGSVFELSPSSGGWIYTDLHDFTGGSDGANPAGSVAIDANGNLYGTTTAGGSDYGVVWEITR